MLRSYISATGIEISINNEGSSALKLLMKSGNIALDIITRSDITFQVIIIIIPKNYMRLSLVDSYLFISFLLSFFFLSFVCLIVCYFFLSFFLFFFLSVHEHRRYRYLVKMACNVVYRQ